MLTSMRILALRSESPMSAIIISVCHNIYHDDIRTYIRTVTIMTSMRLRALRSESPMSANIITVCHHIYHDDIHTNGQ